MLSADNLKLFVTIGTSASLAAAARTLGITPPAVSQRLLKMERTLGLRLIERSSRGLNLTADGELLLTRSSDILLKLADLRDELAERGGADAGVLRLVGPLGFGRRYIAPLVAHYQEMHPNVRVELSLSDRPVGDFIRAYDILVHIGEMQDSEQVATVLAPNRRLLCASPLYIERHGQPHDPPSLQNHRCIALRENDEDVTLWRFRNRRGEQVRVRIGPNLASNDGEVTKVLALAGAGITVRSEWDVADDIRSGRLVVVLPEWTLPDADIIAMLGRRGERTARVNDFLKLLRRVLRPTPWRSGEAGTYD